jgi:hypothetical protein
MRVVKIGNTGIGTDHLKKLQESYYETETMGSFEWTGKVRKSDISNLKLISSPVSMAKLIDMVEMDEYHEGCIDAIAESCFVKFECKNKNVQSFFENIELPGNEDLISTFSDFVYYYSACGNGVIHKLRNIKGEWAGIDRLIPSEIQIAEKYDNTGFLRPDYIQVKNNKKLYIPGKDIIHMIQKTSKSNAWGVACKSIILNVEILNEIKNYDYNNFKNGLLIDYFIIVEGGTFGEAYTEYDPETGKDIEVDPMKNLELVLNEAKGTKNSHKAVFLETSEAGSKIRLEPMRSKNDNGFKELKKDLRDGILVYHRVPHRLVSQETPGKLGGSDNSDMIVFYNMVIKPIQNRLSFILAKEFNKEFSWNVQPSDFDFGNISEVLETIETKLTKK